MKIVIDIDKVLAEGRITPEEYAKLKSLARTETGSLAFNILVGFGVVATAGGAIALLPSGMTALVIGCAVALPGILLSAQRSKEWGVLGLIMVLVGTAMTAGGMISVAGGPIGFFAATIICVAGAILAKSRLLAAMAMLFLSAWIGCAADYEHAVYAVMVRQPTLTVGIFSVVSVVAYLSSKQLPMDYEPLTIVAARTSLFIVNMGFWVGSLWGDSPGRNPESFYGRNQMIPDWVFAVAWALAILCTRVWAARNNKRWVINLLAVFGAIDLYTQFFERLGVSPGTIMIGGLAALGFAFGMVWYNKLAANRPAALGP